MILHRPIIKYSKSPSEHAEVSNIYMCSGILPSSSFPTKSHQSSPTKTMAGMGAYSEAHICQCLNRLMTHRRNATVIINVDGGATRHKTGMQFAQGVISLAHGLSQLGLKPGHVVAIAALNSDTYLEWLLAITCVGGIAAPFNYRWSSEEACQAVNEVKPIMLVTDPTCDHWHTTLQSEIRWHVSMNAVDFTTDAKSSLNPPRLHWPPSKAALLCFTSGTSGKPKAAIISHSALVVQSLAKLAIAGYTEDDVYLHTAPLCHIGGISSALANLMAGARHVILPKFEVKAAVKAIEEHHVTSIIVVPAMMADLMSTARSMKTSKPLETVKKILNGGGGLSAGLIESATKAFPRAKLMTAYGMTEACSSLTFMTLYDPTFGCNTQHPQMGRRSRLVRSGGVCVGKPAPHVEVKISHDGSSEGGKILTRGPHTMMGYWGHIPAQASRPDDEGWFDTGDVGEIDENGNLWLMGRDSGRIKSGGENVYPEQAEAILLQHPGVAAAIVLGLPDPRFTEMVVACVQLKENWKWVEKDGASERSDNCLSKEILKRFCKEKNLTGFKIPRSFILWETPFPMTTTGKVRRNELKREALLRWPKEQPAQTWPSISSNL